MYKTKKNKRYDNISTAILLLAMLAALIFCSKAESADDNTDKIETTKVALEKYIETQRLISKERLDLKLSREMLNERISLIKDQIKEYREKIAKAQDKITEADKEKGKLSKQEDEFKKSSETLEGVVAKLEDRTKSLLNRLPEPIRDRVKPLSQSMPDGTGKNEQAVLQRFQNVAGILNEINKFNGEITVAVEMRPETSVEVSALYIGIGQAYYANTEGTVAGIGVATLDGIEWEPANEYASQILDVIKILENKKVASFVQLPVKVK
ncbi:MAG: DUF3450 domain-containing protein [Phycisphaerae bacterium]|nr:DUF3450 domain-containing protein [Phycisphaerae bacterium]